MYIVRAAVWVPVCWSGSGEHVLESYDLHSHSYTLQISQAGCLMSCFCSWKFLLHQDKNNSEREIIKFWVSTLHRDVFHEFTRALGILSLGICTPPEQPGQTDRRRIYHAVWQDVPTNPRHRLLFLHSYLIVTQHLVDMKLSDALKLSFFPPAHRFYWLQASGS